MVRHCSRHPSRVLVAVIHSVEVLHSSHDQPSLDSTDGKHDAGSKQAVVDRRNHRETEQHLVADDDSPMPDTKQLLTATTSKEDLNHRCDSSDTLQTDDCSKTPL